jgi:NOL1/NOP2/fmu family ribosome biogenesis protein
LYFDEFVRSTLFWQPEIENLSTHGTYIYLTPAGMPDLHGLRVVHWGWWLGSLKVKRFEPSHALVMALQPGDLRQVYALEADDPRTMKYLHGEVLSSPGDDGWVMVAVGGFPMGWAKRVQGRLKSHAPKWLRWM